MGWAAGRPWGSFGVVGAVAVALMLPLQMPMAAADEPTPPPPPDSDEWLQPTGEGLVRPDWLSASVTARSSGQRVEVLAARTEAGRAWMLPDGSVEEELATGPVRFADFAAAESDGWRDIDTTLVIGVDGRVEPKAVPGEMSLSAGGDAAQLISLQSAEGGQVELGAGLGAVELPEPVLQGATATYPDVLPGVM